MSASAQLPVRLSPREGYERWAATYDADPNPLLALEERVLGPEVPCVSRRIVLDIGCGTGRWTRKCLRAGAHAFGFDFSRQMLARAAQCAELDGHVVQADFKATPCRDQSADFIFCSFAAEHCEDLRGIAAEFARIAKPTGVIFVTQLHPAAWAGGWRCGFRDSNGPAEIPARPHTAEDLRHAFAAGDFALRRQWEPHLGIPERKFFVASGREHAFDEACNVPAILTCEFRRGAK